MTVKLNVWNGSKWTIGGRPLGWGQPSSLFHFRLFWTDYVSVHFHLFGPSTIKSLALKTGLNMGISIEAWSVMSIFIISWLDVFGIQWICLVDSLERVSKWCWATDSQSKHQLHWRIKELEIKFLTLMSFSFCSQVKRKEISLWSIKIFEFWHFGRNKRYLYQILGPIGQSFVLSRLFYGFRELKI